MTLEDRLRLHLADKGASWRSEASMTFALWEEDGPRAVALLPQPLSAASVVEAYVARPPGARLTLVHDGPVSPVAQRSAARFGIALLDAALLPAEPVATPPAAEPAPATFPTDALVAAVVLAPAPEIPLPVPTLAEPPALLVAHEPAPLLPAHVEAPPAEAQATVTVEPAAPEVVMEAVAPATVTVEVATPEPVAVPAPVVAPLVEDGPALPWDPATPPASLDAPSTLQVTAVELAALPWHVHAPLEEHVEIMAGSPRARRHVDRPTLAPSLDAGTWGLPWPRPVPTADAVSIADPRIWNARERVHAVREDLDARMGAASFGAVKADGGNWIRRIQTF